MNDDALRPAVNALAGAYEADVRRLGALIEPAAVAITTAAYGPAPHQLLDILSPRGVQGPLPVLLFFHGGGFTHGDRTWNHFMAPAIHAAPAILVSVSYRLLKEGSAGPVPLDDVSASLAWVKANAAAFGGDPDRLFVGGHSAGAALAAAVALRPDLHPQGSLRGGLCLSGSFNRWAITGTDGAGYALPAGPLPCSDDAPLMLADQARVPMLIAWGGQERQRARVERSSMAMLLALAERGVDAEWTVIEEADHFETHTVLADPGHRLARRIAAWIARLS